MTRENGTFSMRFSWRAQTNRAMNASPTHPVLHLKADDDGLRFEPPVLVSQSPTAHTKSWFPEGSFVVGGKGGRPQAVVASVRFNADGAPPLPTGHTDETLISWDAARSWSHLSWQSIYGTPTHLASVNHSRVR